MSSSPPFDQPFPGLRPYDIEDAGRFFGRHTHVAEMISLLEQQRFLAVVGASGSGKSSLVRAGLLPAISDGYLAVDSNPDDDVWRIVITRPGDDPYRALAESLAKKAPGDALSEDAHAERIAHTLRLLRSSQFGLAYALRDLGIVATDHVVLLVDQFEELFRFRREDLKRPHTGISDESSRSELRNDANAFVNLLLKSTEQTEPSVFVILTMRSDFLGDCDAFIGLPEAISRSQYLTPRLTRSQLEEAIRSPLRLFETEIEDALVTRILNDIGTESDQLPLMQHALMRTWKHAREKASGMVTLVRPDSSSMTSTGKSAYPTKLRIKDYEDVGGVHGALDKHANAILSALGDETTHKRLKRVAVRLFCSLSEWRDGGPLTRRSIRVAQAALEAGATESEIETVAHAFQAANLLVFSPPDPPLGPTTRLDISHEALLRQWRLLEDWIKDEAKSAEDYLSLARRAQLWKADSLDLLQGRELQRIQMWKQEQNPTEDWAKRYHPGFANAIAYLNKSCKAEKDKDEAKAQEQRRERRRKQLIGGLVVIVVLALITVWFYNEQTRIANEQTEKAKKAEKEALSQTRIANEQTRIANEQTEKAKKAEKEALSRQLAALANNELARGGLQRALLFAVAGYQATTTEVAKQSLEGALAAQPQQLQKFLLPPLESVRSVAFSPDGKSLASASSDGTVLLWDMAQGTREPKPLKGPQGPVRSVAFSPDGKTLASASSDGTVLLWNVAQGTRQGKPLKGDQGPVLSVAFSPDGKSLASASSDGTVLLWNVAQGTRQGKPLKGPQGPVRSVAFSPDGKSLASASSDGTVLLWNVAQGTRQGKPLKGPQGPVRSVAFSPDGKTLASASSDGAVLLWNVAQGTRQGKPLKGDQESVIISVAFSPDGKSLASAGSDGTVLLWNVAQGTRQGKPLKGPQESVIISVAFSPDGKSLASAGSDGTVLLWNVAQGTHQPKPLKGPQESVIISMAFSPDGKSLASASSDGTVLLWNVAQGTRQGEPLKGNRGPVRSVAFSPDGKTLASVGFDGTVLLWDMAQGTREPKPLKGDQGPVLSMAFSPDGKTLASASSDGTVILWNVAQGTRQGEPLKGDQGPVRSVAFSPDGKTLASAGSDGTVILWDRAQGTRLGKPLKGDQGPVLSVAFSPPDGKTLASASSDGTVLLWDRAQGTRLGKPLKGDQGPVLSVAFSPDGKTLASASSDGTVTLRDVKPGPVDVESSLVKACAIANRNLTHEEWKQSVGQEVSYQAPCPELPLPND